MPFPLPLGPWGCIGCRAPLRVRHRPGSGVELSSRGGEIVHAGGQRADHITHPGDSNAIDLMALLTGRGRVLVCAAFNCSSCHQCAFGVTGKMPYLGRAVLSGVTNSLLYLW